MISLREAGYGCAVFPGQLTPEETQAIESNPAAMRAIVDGDIHLPPVSHWLKFYTDDAQFHGGVAILNILPNPLQVEYHLFYLSTAPKLLVKVFCELAYLYAILNRLQPYTVIKAKPELQYMINFMRRMGAQEVPQHGKIFFYPNAAWQPKHVTELKVTY